MVWARDSSPPGCMMYTPIRLHRVTILSLYLYFWQKGFPMTSSCTRFGHPASTRPSSWEGEGGRRCEGEGEGEGEGEVR